MYQKACFSQIRLMIPSLICMAICSLCKLKLIFFSFQFILQSKNFNLSKGTHDSLFSSVPILIHQFITDVLTCSIEIWMKNYTSSLHRAAIPTCAVVHSHLVLNYWMKNSLKRLPLSLQQYSEKCFEQPISCPLIQRWPKVSQLGYTEVS